MSAHASFGELLTDISTSTGNTDASLAEATGRSPATIRRYRTGETLPAPQVARLLARVLDAPELLEARIRAAAGGGL